MAYNLMPISTIASSQVSQLGVHVSFCAFQRTLENFNRVTRVIYRNLWRGSVLVNGISPTEGLDSWMGRWADASKNSLNCFERLLRSQRPLIVPQALSWASRTTW
jgi:hypothetical protein